MLGRLKLIAEPWDIGPRRLPPRRLLLPLAEWNDRFRDTVRRFWRGDEGIVPELASRLLGSADIFEASGRAPQASLNFVTSHDGFTLADLGSFSQRHNAANGEGNRDGHGDNHGLNHGVEGPSADPAIRAARDRHRRNLLATLLLAQGTPMLLMGDELGHGQQGNNNAYCQDGPLTWLDWGEVDAALLDFTRRLAALRRTRKLLRQHHFLHGQGRDTQGLPDITWLAEDGQVLSAAQWQDPGRRSLGLRLAGADDAPLLLLLNAGAGPVTFRLPEPPGSGGWRLLLDTAEDEAAESLFAATLALPGPSLKLLEAVAT